MFPVRSVRNALRRKLYSTQDGTLIAPADNSPAWVIHAMLVQHRLSSYCDFTAMMTSMPAHMFDISKVSIQTANHFGWYIAHIYPVKNRDTAFQSWIRCEVKRRCFLTLHPCNIFPVPGIRNRQHGEDSEVIAFVATQYALRYGSIWTEFLNEIHAEPLHSCQKFGLRLVQFDFTSPQQGSVSGLTGGSQTIALSARMSVATSYRATRLTFKRDQIEPLHPGEQFEVVTPFGVYRFTKQEFHSEFSSIAQSASYREHGSYNGKNLHLKAEKFRVSPDLG